MHSFNVLNWVPFGIFNVTHYIDVFIESPGALYCALTVGPGRAVPNAAENVIGPICLFYCVWGCSARAIGGIKKICTGALMGVNPGLVAAKETRTVDHSRAFLERWWDRK